MPSPSLPPATALEMVMLLLEDAEHACLRRSEAVGDKVCRTACASSR